MAVRPATTAPSWGNGDNDVQAGFSCWLCSWRLQRTGVQAQEETKLDVAGTFPTSMVILGDVSRTEVQGFLFSDARPAEELIKLVERLRNRDVAAA